MTILIEKRIYDVGLDALRSMDERDLDNLIDDAGSFGLLLSAVMEDLDKANLKLPKESAIRVAILELRQHRIKRRLPLGLLADVPSSPGPR